MATLEYYQQQVEKADKKLDDANAALKTFQESKYKGGKLDELRDKEEREDLNAKEKTTLERLAKEEAELRKRVDMCTEVWVKRDEDLRQAGATTQPVIPPEKRELEGEKSETESLRPYKMLKTQEDIVEAIKSILPPSSAARSQNLSKMQKKAKIYCHRPAELVGQPVLFFHPVFGKFITNYNNENLEVSRDLCGKVHKFIDIMAQTHQSEKQRQQRFDEFLIDALDLNFMSMTVDDGSSNDGVLLENDKYLVALREVKNEIGEGGSDPFLQASFSVLNFWKQKKYKSFRKACNCPTLIMCLAGPWLCIAASIFTDHLIVDPLTDFVPLVPTKHPNEMDHIARLFQAWKLAIMDLKHFYHTDKTVESAWSAKSHCGYQNLFPYPNLLIIDDKKVEFTYESWMSSSKSMCTATISDMNIDVIVKFTKNYCGNAHKLCASEGLAPQLFCVDKKIIPGWTMVIMENIKEAKPLHETMFNLKKDQDQVFQDIQQAISLLHHNNLVFADLRPNNILVYEKDQLRRAMLVDFDWTGVAGKDCYPLFMNHENIDWPAGAEDGKVLQKNHDEVWLERLKNIIFS